MNEENLMELWDKSGGDIYVYAELVAQSEQEPVAWISENAGLYHGKPDKSLNPLPLYLAPPPCPTCEALAQPEQEPVAFVHGDDLDNLLDDRVAFIQRTKSGHRKTALYTNPPQRKPLRNDQIIQILDRERMKWNKSPPTYEFDLAFVRAIEAAHGIKE